MDRKVIDDSAKAALLEFKEEPMDANYKNPVVGIISRGRVKKLFKNMARLSGKRILDVGCEAGYISLEMMKRGGDVVAFDICLPALLSFKRKLINRKINNIPLQAIAQQMPFKDNIFDYVVATEVIEHMPYVDVCIEEMIRVLKPGGRLFITFPNEGLRKLTYPFARLFGINTSVEEHVTLFSYSFKEIVRICRKYGRIKKMYSWPLLFPLTRFVVVEKV